MSREYLLCVDDEAIILHSLKVELRNEFGKNLDIEIATSGREALAIAEELAKEGKELLVAISDQRMPEMDGSEFLSRLKARFPEVLGIMLTGFSEVDAIKRAINEAGLFRFISKPWSSLDLRMAARQAVEHRNLAILNRNLMRQLEVMNRTILATLESIVDVNDPETYDHVRRVSVYAASIARKAGEDTAFRRRLFIFSPLHDIGKVGIPHGIISKPGPLDPEEMAVMRTHVAIGTRLIGRIEVDPMLVEIVRYHHEKWDGTGYLERLSGDAIPLAARIVAIADVFDALLSERPYKKAIDFDAAVEVIKSGSGTHFDPRLVEAFLACTPEFREMGRGGIPSSLIDEFLPEGI
jgi:putative two-component system response regulator